MKSNGSMNRFYRLVWNTAKQVMEPVAETAKSARKNGNSSGSVVAGVVASVALSLMAGMAFAQQAPPAPTQLPTGGNVVRGAASISQVNTATQAILNINQSSAKAVINWNTFNLGQNAKVNFNQPSTSSVTLNQILDNNASQIYGQISANGQVFLSNPNGLYFSPTASVDVGGLVATTHSIDADAFMAGSTTFNRNGATGSVVNEGHLSAGLNGYIALLAPEAINSGVIVAQAGTVVLAAGEAITLNFSGNTSLASITTTPSTIATLVENRQAVLAPDGQIILSANALASLQAGIVKNSGSLQANSMSSHGGVIVLEGDDITLSSTSQIQASGPTGGGTVLVGSGWQGQSIAQVNSTQQATTVTMEAGATIDASATQNGNGGTVVLRSDPGNPNSVTTVAGTIAAQGGLQGGNGGQVETSGYFLNIAGAQVNAGSPQGTGGLWFLDPADSTITQAVANTYATTLNTGTSVLDSVTGSISWGSGVTLTKTAGTSATLTLQIGNYSVNSNTISLNGASINSTSGALNLVLWSSYNSSGWDGAISITGSTINTNGGSFWAGGGNSSTWNGLTVGNASATTWQVNTQGIFIGGSSITTGVGSISLNGESYATSAGNNGTTNFGVQLAPGASLSTTTGSINVNGSLLGEYTNGVGVVFGAFSGSASSNINVSTGSGAINITGTGTDQSGSSTGYRHGLVLNATGENITVKTVSGNISLNGQGTFAIRHVTSAPSFKVDGA